MTECIKPKSPALSGSQRNDTRQDLWDRFLRLAQQFASELRCPLSIDPWDEGQNYTAEDVARWEASAERISAEVDQLFQEADNFLRTQMPPGFKPETPNGDIPF